MISCGDRGAKTDLARHEVTGEIDLHLLGFGELFGQVKKAVEGCLTALALREKLSLFEAKLATSEAAKAVLEKKNADLQKQLDTLQENNADLRHEVETLNQLIRHLRIPETESLEPIEISILDLLSKSRTANPPALASLLDSDIQTVEYRALKLLRLGLVKADSFGPSGNDYSITFEGREWLAKHPGAY